MHQDRPSVSHAIVCAMLVALATLGACNTPKGPLGFDSSARGGRAQESSVALQAMLMDFADTYIALTSQASDNLMMVDRSAARRVLAIGLKLDGAEAVVEIATEPNPRVALLDMVVMVTIEHQVWIDYWKPVIFKDESLNYMDALKRLEKEAWHIAAIHLDPQEVADLRTLAGEIRKRYMTQVFVTDLRASQISQGATEAGADVKTPPTLLTIFGLDPLVGLSPAVAEVTKSRLLAERAFYYAQKLPTLLGWHVELLTAQTMSTPEAEQAMANADTAVNSAARLAALAEALPATISAERAIAIEHAERVVSNEVGRLAEILAGERSALLDGVANEREAFLRAFDERHVEARKVLADLRSTIAAADGLSTSVHGVIDAINVMTTPDANAPATAARWGSRPFDIREYQETLASASGTLRELDAVVKSAKDLVDSPAWAARERMLTGAADDLQRRAIVIALIAAAAFGVALFLGLSGAFLVRRVIGAKAA